MIILQKFLRAPNPCPQVSYCLSHKDYCQPSPIQCTLTVLGIRNPRNIAHAYQPHLHNLNNWTCQVFYFSNVWCRESFTVVQRHALPCNAAILVWSLTGRLFDVSTSCGIRWNFPYLEFLCHWFSTNFQTKLLPFNFYYIYNLILFFKKWRVQFQKEKLDILL